MVKRINGYELLPENLFNLQSKRSVNFQKKMVVPKLNKGDLVKEVAAVSFKNVGMFKEQAIQRKFLRLTVRAISSHF